jgi:hypothetical protein
MKVNEVSVRDVCEFIWDAERKYDLLELEIDGIKSWQCARLEVYYALVKALGLFSNPHGRPSPLTQKVSRLVSYVLSAVMNAPDRKNPGLDFILIDHARKVEVDGAYQDIYTHDFLTEARKEGKAFEVYEYPFKHRHWMQAEQNRKYLDGLILRSNLFGPWLKTRFTPKILQVLDSVESAIYKQWGILFDLKKILDAKTRQFRASYPAAKRILARKKPKRLYIVVAYKYPFWIKAAKALGIEVVEIQHGILNRYHLGYSYPDVPKGRVDYFPDTMQIWDPFWRGMCPMPIEAERIEVRPFEYALRQYSQYADIRPDPKQILIVSQGSIGETLAQTILREIQTLEEYRVVYKLHPSEKQEWDSYPAAKQLRQKGNVKVVAAEEPLYALLAHSTYVVGVNSTVLFEALGFHRTLLILDLPGVDYMIPLIEQNKAIKVETTITAAIEKYENERALS